MSNCPRRAVERRVPRLRGDVVRADDGHRRLVVAPADVAGLVVRLTAGLAVALTGRLAAALVVAVVAGLVRLLVSLAVIWALVFTGVVLTRALCARVVAARLVVWLCDWRPRLIDVDCCFRLAELIPEWLAVMERPSGPYEQQECDY